MRASRFIQCFILFVAGVSPAILSCQQGSLPKPPTPTPTGQQASATPVAPMSNKLGVTNPAIRRTHVTAAKNMLASATAATGASNAAGSGVPATYGTPSPTLAADGDGNRAPTTAVIRVPAAAGAHIRETLHTPTDPASLFDGLNGALKTVVTTVEVQATSDEPDSSQPQPYVAGGAEVISSAGTFGDISRFLQVLPGVVATSDMSNEFLVRGGHPMENLFLVDGIEVPNINHISTLGTTGGFAPMIDSGMVQSLSLHTGGYDANFPERLSSVTEIHTLDNDRAKGHLEGDLGIEGFGGMREQRIVGGDLLASAHHGIMDAVGDNVGLNGIPTYTNEFSRYRRSDSSGNQLSALNVAGWDSISVTPCPDDTHVTSSINSQYSAWRETTGAEWRQVYSERSFGVLEASDSEQIEHINQQDQILNPGSRAESAVGLGSCPDPSAMTQAVPIYAENSNSAFSTAGYRFEQGKSGVTLSLGSAAWLQRPHYQIDQPIGAYSPYSVAPTRADSTSFASRFSTGETGTYLQVSAHPTSALSLSAGARLQTFAFGSHATVTPRMSARYQIGESFAVHAAFAQYAQMPPYVYLVAYPENHSMQPMRATHEIAGFDLGLVPGSQIRVEAYNKQYRDVPVSTEYPSVSLHDMVDMLGQQFVWLPMNSDGTGSSSGVEVSDTTRIRSRFMMRASAAYSRAKFAGLDGVQRPSNFDFPWIANVAGLERFGHGYEVSARYGYATGRPYTPYDIPDSMTQNRPIYDVSQMNALRAPYYGRLDAQMNKDITMHGYRLELYCGVENLLNRSNFLSYVWMPRFINSSSNVPVQELHQISIFPNFGVRLVIR